jgi:hypothetical protein
MGLVLIGLGIAGLLLDTLIEKQSIKEAWTRLRTLSLVLVGCAAAALLNPQGWRIYLFPFESFFRQFNNKLFAMAISGFPSAELVPLTALILLTISVLALSPKKARASEVLLFVVTLYMTLKSNRHMAILALVGVPLLVRHSQHWINSLASAAALIPRPNQSTSRATILASVLLLLPLLLFIPKLLSEVYGQPKQNVVRVPIKAVEYMKENGSTAQLLPNQTCGVDI